ncbi:conserved hypothetical protein [Ricinus communis]|uniref:Retrotransposon gag domain-containing protein n=1 Tax=Ricinus communis TaxID=3988 RepID=B9RY07_RICCO|nr:conserved hypothetical protein [Ricinus communis]
MERIEALEKTLKTLRKHEDFIDADSLILFPNARIPPKFKMLDLDRFDSTSFLKGHLNIYVGAMKPLGINNELLAQLFQRTLKRAILKWFLSLEEKHTQKMG